jgi:PAS domain S-box-containing protein
MGNGSSGRDSRPTVEILLLEDSEIDAELIAGHLAKTGLSFSTERVVERGEFVQALESGRFDIVLADYSLPAFDGLAALELVRSLRPELPFIFVSGVVGEVFATESLKQGATDYVLKRNLTRLPGAVQRALAETRARAERERAQEALRASQINIRLAVNAAKLGMWDYAPLTGDLAWDERCKALFGLPPAAQVSYDTFLSGCHPDDRERMHQAVQRALATDGPGEIAEEFRAKGPAGEERWLVTHGQALYEDGRCVRLIGVLQDISVERRAREELRRQNESLEAAVAERTAERDRIWVLSRDIFIIAGFDGYLRGVNPAGVEALGYDAQELLAEPFVELVHPDDRATLAPVLVQLSEGRPVDRYDVRVRHKGGGHRWISWSGAPAGELFYAVGRDVTDERAAAEELAAANLRLREQIAERERVEETLRQMQRLEAVGQLTSGVAHDFNNLLTVILGNIGFVERRLADQPDARLSQRLANMRSAAERGAKLTGQLLAFSRRQRLEPEPVDLNETVAGMRDLLQSSMGGSIRLETVLNPDLWPALVDATQIELIILNLAINARDAMEVGGSLTLETANVAFAATDGRPDQLAPGDYVRISVTDTGSGMPPEVLAHVFEPFFTTKEVGKGSGLGLAQVYGFANQSGGGVDIRTAIGEGTTVHVFLPRAAGAVRQPAPSRPAEAVARTGRRILVVDDDSAVREVTCTLLQDHGYQVVEAGSGGAALDLIARDPAIELLLVDYAMPGMNGVKVARKALAGRPDLPVLFITGYADLAALAEVGEDRIVQKPFVDDELAQKVREALEPSDPKVVRLKRRN